MSIYNFKTSHFWLIRHKLRVKSSALNKFLGKFSMGKMQLYSFNMGVKFTEDLIVKQANVINETQAFKLLIPS